MKQKNEKGSILVLTLMLTLVILGVGLMAMWMSSSSTKMSANLVRRGEAIEAAKAGLHQAKNLLVNILQAPGDYQRVLLGQNCGSLTPSGNDVALQEIQANSGKGRLLCMVGFIQTCANAQQCYMQNVPVIPPNSQTIQQDKFGADDMSLVTFTAYVRNDEDEYRYCNTVREYGEANDNGNCDGTGGVNDQTDQIMRELLDVDARIILRVEARGKDGSSFAAIETIISGMSVASISNSMNQKGGANGSNQNSTTIK